MNSLISWKKLKIPCNSCNIFKKNPVDAMQVTYIYIHIIKRNGH